MRYRARTAVAAALATIGLSAATGWFCFGSPAMAGEPAADELALRVLARAGNPYSLAGLRFTFVAERDGNEVARRAHTWCPTAMITELRVGDDRARVSARDGSPVADTDPAAAAAAWARFVNDSYWLLAPNKVMDPGVVRAVDEQGRLVLEFDGVGLTPGDCYLMTIADDGRVTGWDYVLQSGEKGSFIWSDHTDVGPMHLSLTRRSTTRPFVIRFEDVEVMPTCPLTPPAP